MDPDLRPVGAGKAEGGEAGTRPARDERRQQGEEVLMSDGDTTS